MGSLNNVQLIGNLGQNPEVKYMPSGNAVCNFSVATSNKWKDKTTGESKEKTEWHKIAVFGKQAEMCGEYLEKGRQVYVSGQLESNDYEKDGVKQRSYQIKANNVTFLGRAGEQSDVAASNGASAGTRGRFPPAAVTDEAPF